MAQRSREGSSAGANDAAVAMGDLPSVIVDDAESSRADMLRQRETARLAQPPARGKSWHPGLLPDGITLPGGRQVPYTERTTRAGRRLLVVAFVSFLIVFLIGAAGLGLHWFLAQSPPP